MHTFWEVFMTFFVYAVIGWLWETFYCSLKARHFVYRGFLMGPYCPVYGFGVASVLLLVPHDYRSVWQLYFSSIIIVTAVEYVTSYLLQKLFNMKLWDYSHVPLNINGRVALPISMFWGIGCVVLIKYIQPHVGKFINQLIDTPHSWVPMLLLILFTIDLVTTLKFTITSKKEVASQITNNDPENAGIKQWRWDHIFKNHEESSSHKKVSNYLQGKTSAHQRNLNRVVKNYPNMTFTKDSKQKEN